MAATTRQTSRPQTKELVDALLAASRALVAVTAKSLGAWKGEVTLAQYRVLLLLSSRGTLRVADLADALTVSPPSATRICARLAHKELVRRTRSPMDRRTVRVSITPHGREVMEEVSAVRRAELGRIVEQMPVRAQERLIEGLPAFTSIAGEPREEECSAGRTSPDGKQARLPAATEPALQR